MNLHPDYLLKRVEEPEDIKSMTIDQLKQLAEEMRTLVLERVSAIGGHVGPDLGIVELAIAYHYVRLFGSRPLSRHYRLYGAG